MGLTLPMLVGVVAAWLTGSHSETKSSVWRPLALIAGRAGGVDFHVFAVWVETRAAGGKPT